MGIMIHRCPGADSLNLKIRKEMGYWRILVSGDFYFSSNQIQFHDLKIDFPVNYCPLCGQKLPTREMI